MNRDLTPTEGARFLLELLDAARGRYRASIFTPTETFVGEATLSADGSVELELPGAPEDLAAKLGMFAKLTARSGPPWPARILRWRAR